MKVELRSPDNIIPYEKNPRKNDSAVKAVARSIKEFGFRQPIVIDEHGVIIVGHTRWKAARRLKLAAVPVHVAEGMTADQAKAYRIADNQSASIALWDEDLLVREIDELQKTMDFDIEVLGFGELYLKELFERSGHGEVGIGFTDPDEIPDLNEGDATCKPGDLWQLGNHRLLCGDAGDMELVRRLMNGRTIQLIHTDPPYNADLKVRSGHIVGTNTNRRRTSSNMDSIKNRRLKNDKLSKEKFQEKANAWFSNMAEVLDVGRSFYIWGGYFSIGSWMSAFETSGLKFRQTIAWIKEHPSTNYNTDFLINFELGFYGWKEGAKHVFFGSKSIQDTWVVKKLHHSKTIHLAEKPVELARRAIDYSSRLGENVLDLFGGSGSTLIAAEQMGRNAFMMEIDVFYCDRIIARWEAFTGKKAVLEVGS